MELTVDLNKRYTYADYITWIDDKTRELIDKIIKKMYIDPHSLRARINRDIFRRLDDIVTAQDFECKKNSNYKYGFFDRNGREVIPCKYNIAGTFIGRIAFVKLGNKYN